VDKLDALYQSLVERGEIVYRVQSSPTGRWALSGAKMASVVKFNGNLVVYHDEIRGYQIANVNQFSNGQLVLQQGCH